MKKICTITVLLAGWFLLCAVGLANATSVTQGFYVKIDSISITRGWMSYPWFDQQAALNQYPLAAVGSIFYGLVIYDNTNIPNSGAYIIGFTDPGYVVPDPLANEFQSWNVNWNGIGMGWMFDPEQVPYPRLYFMDGKLSGIDSIYHGDHGGDHGIENEGFFGTDYISYGSYNYSGWIPGHGLFFLNADYNTHGTLNVVPEPATMLLLGLGLVGLAGVRRKFKN